MTVKTDCDIAPRSLAEQRRQKRSDSMVSELESIALALFEKRGFSAVTVEEIAAAAEISPRTFYRYFSTKEDVLLVHIRRRSEALRAALAKRPSDEAPLQSIRVAVGTAVSAEDPAHVRRWAAVVESTPSALMAAYGGCILLQEKLIAEFFASRLGTTADALQPAMMAAAVGGVIQAALYRWLSAGGSLTKTTSDGLEVLKGAIASGFGSGVRGNASPMRAPRPVNRRAKAKLRR